MVKSVLIVTAAAVCSEAAVLRINNFANRSSVGPHGKKTCPCIGIDNVEGETMATIKGGKKVPYPADLGAHCAAWDSGRNPECTGKEGQPSWCEAKWCYVDPCSCEKVSPYPKPSLYMPNSEFQGKPVHFSYATCDGMDSYSETGAGSDMHKIEKTCAVDVDSAKWGQEDCRCVGVFPQEGHLMVDVKGKQTKFPADTGSKCHTWEADNHPDCKSGSPPSWCNQAWCYVDPCKCRSATPPKTSSYVPHANYQGRPVYYSYASCGGKDTWTDGEHKNACVNQKSKDECGKLSKCAWDGKECLGKELVQVCSGAWAAKAIVALAVPLLAFLY